MTSAVAFPGSRFEDDIRTVHAAFEHTRRVAPDAAFLHIPQTCAGGAVDLTYEGAGRAIARLITAYREAGYRKGHHVGLLLESRASFFVHWFALNALGVTIVPIGAELAPAEVGYIVDIGDVDLIVHLAERQTTAMQGLAAVPTIRAASVEDVETGMVPAAAPPRTAGDDDDSAAIVFTSGSTGRPKGCVLSNDYFLAFGRWYRDLGGRCTLRPGQERLITPLPLNHVNALAFSCMGMVLTGGCVIQLDRFRSDEWWETVHGTGATVMHYLGVMPAMLLQRPADTLDRTHALGFGFGGGVRFAHHQAFEDRFGFPLIEAWAMTETGGAGTISTHVGPRHVGTGCIGRPSAKYSEARIVSEADQDQPPDVIGELVVRAAGPNPRRGFFAGYYKDPAATAAAWKDGWLHTGDLARRDAEGSIYFVGRRKQVIRRSGENISAAEIEAVLSADQTIKEVTVVPVPDEIREEEVFALVVPRAGVTPSMDVVSGVMERAARQLSYFKLPGYLAFAESLPVTATQKPRYGATIDLARAMIERSAPTLFDVRAMKRRYRARER